MSKARIVQAIAWKKEGHLRDLSDIAVGAGHQYPPYLVIAPTLEETGPGGLPSYVQTLARYSHVELTLNHPLAVINLSTKDLVVNGNKVEFRTQLTQEEVMATI